MDRRIMISIVIPVYNVENYLVRCLDSILAQTYKYWECILVDDGSSDGSGSICDIYAERDDRFKVMHKPNSGANLSRKEGFKIARGEYVIFIDSDDYIEETMLEKMYNSLKDNGADMCICSWYTDGDNYSNKHFLPISDNIISKGEIMKKYIEPSVWSLPKIDGFPSFWWLRLIRKECIPIECFVSERILLPEDLVSQLHIAFKVKSVAIVNEPLYHYWYNPTSFTNSHVKSGLEKRLACYAYIKDLLISKMAWNDSTKTRMDYFLICAIHFSISNMCRLCDYREFRNQVQSIFSDSILKHKILSFDYSKCDIQKKLILCSYYLKCYYPLYIYLRWRMHL